MSTTMYSIEEAGSECEKKYYSETSLNLLKDTIQYWVNSFEFRDRSNSARVNILNDLTFLLSNPNVRTIAWSAIEDLTRRYPLGDEYEIGEFLIVTTFELTAEPPDVPYFLELLFSLTKSPATRWAVFAAYRRWPGRFSRHIHEYSNGLITQEEYVNWLETQGLYITSRGIRCRRR